MNYPPSNPMGPIEEEQDMPQDIKYFPLRKCLFYIIGNNNNSQ